MDAIEFRVLCSWDNTYPIRSVLLEEFVKNVEAASKRDLTFSISGPETVPPFEQLQPVASGAFQILVTHGAYHFGTSSMLIATEGFTGDLAQWRHVGGRDDRPHDQPERRRKTVGRPSRRPILL